MQRKHRTDHSTRAARANRLRRWDAKPRASKLTRGDREAAGLPAPKEELMTERALTFPSAEPQALHDATDIRHSIPLMNTTQGGLA